MTSSGEAERVEGRGLEPAFKAFALSAALRSIQAGVRGRALHFALKVATRCWGNVDWVANADFLEGALREVGRTHGTVLECGSGLSTLILGAATLAGRRRVISLEHSRDWAGRVQHALDLRDYRHVEVRHAPLAQYGEYDWYAVDSSISRERFDLVICDGPPGSTKGGRYGLIPRLGARLTENAVVVLDDAWRGGEQAALNRWRAEFGAEWKLAPVAKAYAVATGFGVRRD